MLTTHLDIDAVLTTFERHLAEGKITTARQSLQPLEECIEYHQSAVAQKARNAFRKYIAALLTKIDEYESAQRTDDVQSLLFFAISDAVAQKYFGHMTASITSRVRTLCANTPSHEPQTPLALNIDVPAPDMAETITTPTDPIVPPRITTPPHPKPKQKTRVPAVSSAPKKTAVSTTEQKKKIQPKEQSRASLTTAYLLGSIQTNWGAFTKRPEIKEFCHRILSAPLAEIPNVLRELLISCDTIGLPCGIIMSIASVLLEDERRLSQADFFLFKDAFERHGRYS